MKYFVVAYIGTTNSPGLLVCETKFLEELQLIDIPLNIDSNYRVELAESQINEAGGFVCPCERYLTSSIGSLVCSGKNTNEDDVYQNIK